jgi:hypothetical protein
MDGKRALRTLFVQRRDSGGWWGKETKGMQRSLLATLPNPGALGSGQFNRQALYSPPPFDYPAVTSSLNFQEIPP